tara:strand:- start:180 stop:353 length:174 start_codon:yes stop_codon:yes gene_type:complete
VKLVVSGSEKKPQPEAKWPTQDTSGQAKTKREIPHAERSRHPKDEPWLRTIIRRKTV